MSDILISCKDVHKVFSDSGSEVPVLRGLSVDIHAGDAVAILGSSGAGKSTLLHILGALDRPDKGEVIFQGEILSSLSDDRLAEIRNQKMGFVFQFHHLLPEFTALENVLMPVRISGLNPQNFEDQAIQLFKRLGIEHRLSHLPRQLSGGEMQRVSIARALIMKPLVVFADEPTGNIDSENAQQVQKLFFELQNELKTTLITVTHDLQFAKRFPRVLRMKDGLWDTQNEAAQQL